MSQQVYTYFVPVMNAAGTSSPTDSSGGIISVCSNGYTGIESSNGLACCVAECGQCGGVGCSTVGLPDLGGEACCSSDIVDFGVSCEETDSAPCYIEGVITCLDEMHDNSRYFSVIS